MGSLYTLCVITVKLLQATRSQSILRRLEELQVEDEGEIQHLGTNIPLVSCISTSWHCLLKSRSILHGYLLSTYRCGIRILSAMVWSQGSADYTASPFPEHNYWSCGTGFRRSSVPVTRQSLIIDVLRDTATNGECRLSVLKTEPLACEDPNQRGLHDSTK